MTSFDPAPASHDARRRLAAAYAAARAWLAKPKNLQRAGLVTVPVLVLLGLLLPPVSLVTRLTTLSYEYVKPGRSASVKGDLPGSSVDIDRAALRRATRIRLRSTGSERPPRGVDALPPGREPLQPLQALDIRGPVPRAAMLSLPLDLPGDSLPFVDPYGWDGERWRWLSPQFPGADRVRVTLPLGSFVPELVALTLATESATEVSAVLEPPPASVPAAVAELPILELRAYWLASDDGTVAGEAFAVPAREARRYGVISNGTGERVRSDLINNILIRPDSRQRHREAIVDLVRRDALDGVVLDYRGIAADLQPTYAGLVRRLAADLEPLGADVIVTVPMPRQTARGWDAGGYLWNELGDAGVGVRVLLPNDAPLEIETLDSMVRWALTQVERGRLQLALPAQGRDLLLGSDEATPISYGEALGRILDMARSDAPGRITPGESAKIELPTIKAAELARDPATGMWRFHYWDDNRRQHTVWLNDAEGTRPAFDIASRYRLGRLALDGVEAGLDPTLWQMVRAFVDTGQAEAPGVAYRLQWQLVDGAGRVIQQALQPLEQSSFAFRAPRTRGKYRLGVNLVTADGDVAALGSASDVFVAPPPPPTPRPTMNQILQLPSPIPYQTAPPPADELEARIPVPVAATPAGIGTGESYDAVVTVARAELRDGPGVRFDRVADLRAGDRLEITGRTPDGLWLRVRIMSTGVAGWVLAELLEIQSGALAPPPVITTPTATASPG